MARHIKEKMYISQETLDKYKEEYKKLIEVERPAVQAALKEARAQGDLSENAEYDAARDRQSEVEGRILELESIIERSLVIPSATTSKSNERASIGATVTYLNLATNTTNVVTIMGVHDSDPLNNKISNESPVAKAIMDTKVGSTVEVDAPQKYSIKILQVEYK
ncbi:transcription elongation factor GreA [Mycoplasmopsis felifaucium]|uniref:transcription elongation factor GreA n=1 Tax=Mycoplasmopsis felifaucium TaxID=35768 RepID=UPI000484F380|nr:transcription elongation factor GreA [Mycoplasmopsis felifaucium]